MALALGLGALALGFGVALPTTAGYLISRAAEQPPILSLTTIIVVVRFLALARPVTRYLERLSSHDLALRTLGPLRARVYQRIEPLAPTELAAFRQGDLLTRMVGDVDALQALYLRGIGPPLVGLAVAVACVVAMSLLLPAAALVLAAGLALAGIAVPLLGGKARARGPPAARRQRGESSPRSSWSSSPELPSSWPSAARTTPSPAFAPPIASSSASAVAMRSSRVWPTPPRSPSPA